MAGISLCTEHLICHDSATDGHRLPPRLGCRTRRCSDQGADWRFPFSGRSPSRGVAGSSGSSIRRCPAGAVSVRVPPPSLVFVGAARPRLPVALTCSSPMASGAGRLSATCASPSGGCLLGRPGHRRLDRLFLAVELHGSSYVPDVTPLPDARGAGTFSRPAEIRALGRRRPSLCGSF